MVKPEKSGFVTDTKKPPEGGSEIRKIGIR